MADTFWLFFVGIFAVHIAVFLFLVTEALGPMAATRSRVNRILARVFLVPSSLAGAGLGTLLVALLALTAAAEARGARTFPLPGHGDLELVVPRSWREEVRRLPQNLPITITLRPGQGDDFVVMVTPLWSPTGDPAFNTPATVRRLIDADWRRLAASAEEPALVLRPLDGPEARGFYFFATDRAPKPGEWKYLTRVVLGLGDLLVTGTILSRQQDADAVRDALAALREARQLNAARHR